MPTQFRRRRLLVDPKFQFRILLRVGLYLALFVFIVLHLGFLFEFMFIVAGGRPLADGVLGAYVEYLSQHRSLLGVFILVSPVLLYDMFKFSHRFAGPLYRCRKIMQAMAAGETVPQFKPREHDLMTEFFADFNALILEWNRRLTGNGAGENGRYSPGDHEETACQAISASTGS